MGRCTLLTSTKVSALLRPFIAVVRPSRRISNRRIGITNFLGHRSYSNRPSVVYQVARCDDDGGDDDEDDKSSELTMENIYTEWTLDDDKLLWEHRHSSAVDQAALLGRGLRGVEARLKKLRNVNTPAYERLFAQGSNMDQQDDTAEKKKLIPVSEILRRVQWDYSLSAPDFSILHYDRVDDTVVESPMDAPNQSIQGKSTMLVDALPEHRIVAVKYREQVVWDREKRMDKFFSNGGIEAIILNYDEWKRKKDANWSWLRQRQTEVTTRVRRMLGPERYAIFKSMSQQLQSTLDNSVVSVKMEAETYVKASLELFRQVRNDPSLSLEPFFIPRSDTEALECLSELVALSPNDLLRQTVLSELSLVLNRLDGRSSPPTTAASAADNHELPEISEDDITETFVKGSGAGGQKVNKTSNKVLLVHNPTNIRVECQETRYLQQNRKIARKRLRLKLDEFLNGDQSRVAIKAEKDVNKKAKAKARSRARNRKKAAAKNESE